MKNNEKAQAEFIAKIGAINTALDELKDYAEDHMGFHPDEINWGHVGAAERLLAALTELTDQAYGRGEYAKSKLPKYVKSYDGYIGVFVRQDNGGFPLYRFPGGVRVADDYEVANGSDNREDLEA